MDVSNEFIGEYFPGVVIDVVPSKIMQKGRAVLMVHPDDMPLKIKIDKVNTNGK